MKYANLKKSDRLFYFINLFVIYFLFSFLFYFSFKYIVNIWAYSDAFINYSEGFIRRGMLGELMSIFSKNFSVKPGKFHASFFMIVTMANILIFAFLLKDYISSKLIFVFLLFNPALILFSLYDNGAYLRKELIFITVSLLHCYFVNRYHKKIISKKYYLSILYFLIIPLIIFNILMHELQYFLLLFHVCLTFNVLFEEIKFSNLRFIFQKKIFYFLPYILTIIPLILFYIYPTELSTLEKIYTSISIEDKAKVAWEPIFHTSNPFLQVVVGETKYMFSSKGNAIFYLTLLVMAIGPIILIFNYLKKNNCIELKNYFLIFFSVFPIFLMFFIGRDWGRWINLIAFTVILFYLQNPLKRDVNIEIINLSRKFYQNFIICLTITLGFLYLIFIAVPHCCPNQTMFGGLINNISLFFQIIIYESLDLGDILRAQS